MRRPSGLREAVSRGEHGNELRSVTRTLDILRLYGTGRPQLGVTEIARTLRVSKSTAHRLLQVLADRGIVMQDTRTRQYRLGLELLRLGRLVRDGLDLRREALAVMQRLQGRTGETVNLNVERDGYRICVEKVESTHPIRDFVEIGRPLPLYAGASGKVLLAHLPLNRVADVLRHAVPGATASRVPRRTALLRQLKQIRQAGYASSSEERVEGAASISAPIRDADGTVIAGISVSGPTYRFQHRVREFAPLVVRAAREISERLGYREAGRPEGGARHEAI